MESELLRRVGAMSASALAVTSAATPPIERLRPRCVREARPKTLKPLTSTLNPNPQTLTPVK